MTTKGSGKIATGVIPETRACLDDFLQPLDDTFFDGPLVPWDDSVLDDLLAPGDASVLDALLPPLDASFLDSLLPLPNEIVIDDFFEGIHEAMDHERSRGTGTVSRSRKVKNIPLRSKRSGGT